MTKAIIYVVRHGKLINPNKILYGDSMEMDLSDEGREQIKLLGEEIKRSGQIPSKIYSSYLQRTLESANILAKILAIDDVQIEKDLADSHVPAFAGKPSQLRKDLHATGHDEYEGEYVVQGDETRQNIVDRMYGIFQKAFKEHKGGCSMLVSHGDPIRFLLWKLENPNSTQIECMAKMAYYDYLPKGCAWKFVLDSEGNMLEKTMVEPGTF